MNCVKANVISNVLYNRGEYDFVNEMLCDTGVDLTCVPNSLMRGHRKFLYYIGPDDIDVGNEKLLLMFCCFDACLLEKIKYIQSIGEMHHLIYTREFSLEKLLEARYKHLTSSKEAIWYEYRDNLSLTIKAIRLALGIDEYRLEYTQLCNIAEEIITKHNNARNEKEDKRKAEALSILTIILTIPSVTILVDIFYNFEIATIIYFPINTAKLLWVLVALILSLCYFNKDNLLKKLKPMFSRRREEE